GVDSSRRVQLRFIRRRSVEPELLFAPAGDAGPRLAGAIDTGRRLAVADHPDVRHAGSPHARRTLTVSLDAEPVPALTVHASIFVAVTVDADARRARSAYTMAGAAVPRDPRAAVIMRTETKIPLPPAVGWSFFPLA